MQVDLCHGPHLPNTGLLKASAVSAVNRAHWRADVNNEPLQVTLCHCARSELLWCTAATVTRACWLAG